MTDREYNAIFALLMVVFFCVVFGLWMLTYINANVQHAIDRTRDVARENQDLLAGHARIAQVNARLVDEKQRLKNEVLELEQQLNVIFLNECRKRDREIHVGRPLCTETDPNAPIQENDHEGDATAA